ncbi:MAG: hypothetical protein WA921_11560 [Ahrensia sp.]
MALLIAPSIWRRAVFLTRKRIESSVPLTANELQADKDRLRAEHAMSVRRLESQLDDMRDKWAASDGAVGRLKEQLKSQTDKQRESQAKLVDTERELAMLRSSTDQTQSDIANAKLEVETLQANLQTRRGELDSVSRMKAETEKRLLALTERFEIINTDLAKARDEIAALKEGRRDAQAKVREAHVLASENEQALKTERAKTKSLEVKLERAVRSASDLEAKLARREREFARQQETRALQIGDAAEFENRALAAERDRDDLERELADLTLRYNTLEKAKGANKESTDTEALEIKLAQALADAKSLKAQRDAALAAAASGGMSTQAGSDDESLRDQMNQLAAEMVHLTSMLEGDSSPIKDLIGERKDGDSKVISLADRVRMLRDAANKAAE